MVLEKVGDNAEVRERRSSFLSRTHAWRRPLRTAAAVAAPAVVIVVARHALTRSPHVLAAASPGWPLPVRAWGRR